MKSKFLILLLITLFSCTKEYNTIGTDILKSDTFKTNVELVPINVVQKAIPPFKSNALPAYQLGSINDNVFGKSEASFITQVNLSEISPNFGLWSQQRENDGDDSNIAVIEENETVTNVYLDIPFFNNTFDSDGDGVIDIYDVDDNDINSDSDGDGLTDIQERANGTDPLNPDTDGDGITDDKDTDTQNPNSGATLYDVDSLLGNRDASFKIKVQELDYYLRSYDPTDNFESFQKYYSDETQLLNFAGFTIHDDEVSIDTNEIVIYKEDDPDTDDVDESEEVKERLTPRLRMPLDKVRKVLKISKEPVSLEKPVGDEEDSSLGDFIEDTKALAPLEQAIKSNLGEATTKILSTLTPREERVLRMRFGVGMNTDHTLEEVGLQFSVTRERIRQIEATALRKLKHPSRSKQLKSFLES